MKLSQIRRDLYRSASILGHVQAVKRGRIWQRVLNVYVWRAAAQFLRALLK